MDRELCDRWLAQGHATAFAPQAVVMHEHALSLAGFCRQHFGYGRGARRLHLPRVRASQRLAPRSHELPRPHPRCSGAGCGRSALGARSFSRACLALWEAANAAGYLREALGTEPL
jgi:hypothetical protein